MSLLEVSSLRILFGVFALVLVLSGCGQSNEFSQVDQADIDEYEVMQTFDEKTEDDFIFRLVSGKEEYLPDEPVELYGEIIYTGDEKLEIVHGSSSVIFEIQEHVRGHIITHTIQEIAMYTHLIPNEPYRENYTKHGIFYSEFDSKEYIEFIEDFKNRDGFPPGYYTVKATTAFYDGTMHREIEAEVDFKVVTGTAGK